VRIAVGPRDVKNNTAEIARRDTLEKETIPAGRIKEHVVRLLEDIQKNIYRKALQFREENTYYPDSWEEFKNIIEDKGGFVMAHWDGTPETEARIKEETKATIRCIPIDSKEEKGKCIYSGKPSGRRVLFAVAY